MVKRLSVPPCDARQLANWVKPKVYNGRAWLEYAYSILLANFFAASSSAARKYVRYISELTGANCL